jgi:hypothetical protein
MGDEHRWTGTVGRDKEGHMELVIVVVLAIVTLGWGARMTPGRTVHAPACVAPGVSWRRAQRVRARS